MIEINLIIVLMILNIVLLRRLSKQTSLIKWYEGEHARWRIEFLLGQHVIVKDMMKILALLTPIEGASDLEIVAIIDGQEIRMDQMNLKKGQRVELVVKATAKGKPAKIDGDVTYAVPVGLVIVDADGKKFLQASDDADESAPVLFAADADGDLGEGVKPLHFEAAINILAADADTLEITFGAPEAIPEVAPAP